MNTNDIDMDESRMLIDPAHNDGTTSTRLENGHSTAASNWILMTSGYN